MFDPADPKSNLVSPPVHVEQIIADRKTYDVDLDTIGQLRLPPLIRDLEIDYTALSLAIPQRVRFRYKLDRHDVSWQEPGKRRQAFYSDLPPGKYLFHVIAANSDGEWNTVGATIALTVAPAWYQEVWFRALCVFLGVVAIALLYRLLARQIARDLRARFDERLAERTRLARDLHDTFLQTIQGSKLVADNALDPDADPAGLPRAMEQLSAWLERATQESR